MANDPFEGSAARARSGESEDLVLACELDPSTTSESMAAIARRIPSAIYQELPRTPHMQTLERPGLVIEALSRFLPGAPTSRSEGQRCASR
jgi:pimeloyl-ACP methyl ester carboxylesterase